MRALQLSEVAALVGGTLIGGEDPTITGVAGLEEAGPGDLTFLGRSKLASLLKGCRASGVIIGPEQETVLPAVVVDDPYAAFATVLREFVHDLDRVFPPGVHPTAVIDATAEVADSAAVGPYCVVGAGTLVGAETRLGPHVCLGPDVSVGSGCLLYAQVTVREGCRLGNDVIIHSGAVIGADGFGFLPTPEGLAKIPQVGIVEIEDRVEIGAGACIDRATTGKTVIGAGTKIDNQVQVGHNVRIGRHCALSAQTGISGSCELGDWVTAGGQVGVADHLKIGSQVKIGAKSGIARDIPAGSTVFGYPALEFNEAFRIVGALRKLPELLRRVSRLEKDAAGSDRQGG